MNENEIVMIATFPNIPEENVAAFTAAVAESLDAVRTEKGNLQYDWFMDDDRSRCVVLERYRDAAAVVEHVGNVAEVLPRLAQLGGGVEIDVFGTLPADLHAALESRVRAIHGLVAGK